MSEVLANNVLSDENQTGDIKISNEAIGVIASIAAMEIEGVNAMAGRTSKSVKIEVKDGTVKTEISIIVKTGYRVPDVSVAVQEKVKSAIEGMTGLTVSSVLVKVAGVSVS